MYAANGLVSFEDPAYAMLRYRLNLILRYGHEFTMSRVLLTVVRPVPARYRDQAKWENALKALPSEEAREALEGFNRTLSVAILQLMIYRSFLCYLLVRPFMPTVRMEEVVRKHRRVASTVARLESETLDEARSDSPHDKLVTVS